MKYLLKGIGIVILGLLCSQTIAQTVAQTAATVADSIQKTAIDSTKIHLPNKATIFSAVLPGMGQVYNRQWWKVPFIYGGFVGLGMTIEFYNRYYNNYKRAYFELNDKNPKTTYYTEFLLGNNIDESNAQQYNSQLTAKIESLSRSRDLFIIGTVGFYLLNILDANVNAHFIDFDIGEDLTFNFEPVGVDVYTNTPILGVRFNYNF